MVKIKIIETGIEPDYYYLLWQLQTNKLSLFLDFGIHNSLVHYHVWRITQWEVRQSFHECNAAKDCGLLQKLQEKAVVTDVNCWLFVTNQQHLHSCYSLVTCKVLLNWLQASKLG